MIVTPLSTTISFTIFTKILTAISTTMFPSTSSAISTTVFPTISATVLTTISLTISLFNLTLPTVLCTFSGKTLLTRVPPFEFYYSGSHFEQAKPVFMSTPSRLMSVSVSAWASVSHQLLREPPSQILLGRHVFCSLGHWLLIFAMTLTFCSQGQAVRALFIGMGFHIFVTYNWNNSYNISDLVWLNQNSEQKLWWPLYKNGLPHSKRGDLSRDLDHAASFSFRLYKTCFARWENSLVKLSHSLEFECLFLSDLFYNNSEFILD